MNQTWLILKTPSLIYTRIFSFVLNIMHGWGAMYFRICLAPKYHGYSISAQNYEFCSHLAQLDNLDFTLSHMKIECIPRPKLI